MISLHKVIWYTSMFSFGFCCYPHCRLVAPFLVVAAFLNNFVSWAIQFMAKFGFLPKCHCMTNQLFYSMLSRFDQRWDFSHISLVLIKGPFKFLKPACINLCCSEKNEKHESQLHFCCWICNVEQNFDYETKCLPSHLGHNRNIQNFSRWFLVADFSLTGVLISSNCSRIRLLLKRHNLLFEGF